MAGAVFLSFKLFIRKIELKIFSVLNLVNSIICVLLYLSKTINLCKFYLYQSNVNCMGIACHLEDAQ